MHCIMWALRTSLDGPVRVSTLNYLATTTLAVSDPTLVADCFEILLGCMKVTGSRAAITQGMEQLATASVSCCLHTLSHLMVMGPAQRVFENIRHRYVRVFPLKTKFDDLPFFHTLGIIHGVFYPNPRLIAWLRWESPCKVKWEDCKLSSNEHVVVARALVKLARFEYQKNQYEKVPRRFLRFALWSLSQSPLPPTSVVVNCLLMITIDLGCDFTLATTSEERCVHTSQISTSLTNC